MPDSFLDPSTTALTARIHAIASTAAGAPVAVRVGEERHGYRNVGIDLPSGRRSADEKRLLRQRVWEALERSGVVMAPNALAPKVDGDLRGTVRAMGLQVGGASRTS
jgi:hypothetical protein